MFESQRETSSARVSTAAIGAGKGCKRHTNACQPQRTSSRVSPSGSSTAVRQFGNSRGHGSASMASRKKLAHVRFREEVRIVCDDVEGTSTRGRRSLCECRKTRHCRGSRERSLDQQGSEGRQLGADRSSVCSAVRTRECSRSRGLVSGPGGCWRDEDGSPLRTSRSPRQFTLDTLCFSVSNGPSKSYSRTDQ